MRPVLIIAAILLALGAVEGTAYWWMHPAPAGLGERVLVYQPKVGPDRRASPLIANGAKSKGTTGNSDQENAPAQNSSSDQQSSINNHQSEISSSSPIQNPKFNIQNSSSPSSTTNLPEVVAKSLPSLHCSTGTAARIDRDDDVTIHVAFFEWNLTDTTNVLEAYKHLPEQCLGSIGLILTKKAPPRSYKVGNETLSFDHTVFRDQVGVTIHAFKGTWVSGASNLLGDGLRGGEEQWRQIRWRAALKRFRPAHARVAQGAVRGIPNPDLAWVAFEEAMLVDLKFER